jgi:lysophospholipase L1-like esterase
MMECSTWDTLKPANAKKLRKFPHWERRGTVHGAAGCASFTGEKKKMIFKKVSGLGVAVLCLFCVSLAGQQAMTREEARRELEKWRASRAPELMNDFAELGRYRDANAKLPPAAAGEKRVVFLGDSITDGWHLAESFPGKPYVNRGISGQTTPQMLIRFRPDVIALQPKAVVILAGINDMAGNTGLMSLEETEANYASMAELAHAHGIQVIFSSVLPMHNYTEQSLPYFLTHDPAQILEVNRWLKRFCAANGYFYLDYFSAMVDDKGLLKKELAEDGLHPNAAGYKIMAGLAEGAIEKVLGGK